MARVATCVPVVDAVEWPAMALSLDLYSFFPLIRVNQTSHLRNDGRLYENQNPTQTSHKSNALKDCYAMHKT